MKFRKNKKGFTLIELIVVIAILGILAVILIPSFSGIQDTANQKAALAEARTVATAVQAYKADNNNLFPSAASQLTNYGATAEIQSNITSFGTDGTFTYNYKNAVTVAGTATGTVSITSPAAASN